jgi:RNA polymerase sigma-70 factor (ECF subfamily)
MAAYCDGDRDAFAALYEVLASRVRSYFARLADDHAAVDDLAQDLFVRLHLARKSYVRGSDPLPWIFTIARRLFLDQERRRRLQRQVQRRLAHERHAASDGEPALETRGERPEPLAQLLRALAQLPPDQRAAIESTHLAGRTARAAAPALGITPGNLKVRVHRGLRALRAAVVPEAEGGSRWEASW